MASWRAPGSILEAPGSIFEAPRLDLGGFWNDFFDIFGKNTKKAKKRLKPAKQELNHKWPDCQGWVGGGAPPPGGFNPPPTEGVRSVLDNNHIAFQIRPDQITKGESERPGSLC